MAGIGFQLRNLIKENSFFWGIKGFAFSTIVIAGPMILCIFLITVAQHFLNIMNTPYFERELFLAGTLYSFVFSQLITSGLIMLATRYLADQLFARKNENVLSSLYGIVALALLVGGVTGIAFYSFSPLDIVFKIFSYFFFIELVITWLLTMYISALKNYLQIIRGFLIGVIISVIAIWFCYGVLNFVTATQMFACMDLGFFITILLFFRSIRRKFPVNNQRYFEFLTYFAKYPSLFLIGLFYTLGLYGHIFIVWWSDLQTIVSNTFVMATLYDTPIFYAYLTIIPAMVMFVVSVETSFYERYKSLYSKILGSSSFQDIKEAQSKMFNVLSRELMFIMEFQLFFTICAIALGTKLLPLTIEQVDIFNIVVIGNYFFIMMFIVMQILLYFDDRKGVLLVISSYVIASTIFTVITVMFKNYGLSCFIAGLIGLGLSFSRLYHYSKNFGYYTYCSQPLVKKEEKTFLNGFVEKLNSLNGVVGGKYETKE